MSRPSAHRYHLDHPELDPLVDALVVKAQEAYGEISGADFVRELILSAIRLVRDKLPRGDLKLLNSAVKELRHAFHVFAPFERVRKVAIFGSARTPPQAPAWKQAHEFAERITSAGWMVITGGGDGIMGAAQGGAGRERSFGVNIRLPFEQAANKIIAGDRKLINFRYFFTRKLMFIRQAHAVALFPGGFGTHDEGFEALTLVQTGKSEMIPIVFVDSPGGSYWRDWEEYVATHLRAQGMIHAADMSLFKVTDDVEVAARELLRFYANYHSSRYVGELLSIRLRRAPTAEQMDQLNLSFPDILTGGRIEAGPALPEEQGEHGALPRLLLRFNRRDTARLRQLIDALNAYVPDDPLPPADALPHEIRPV
ncbi:MAG: LOG family protein [Planctomycetaceae bacterium]